MLIAGAREDDLLLFAVVSSHMHQNTARITIDAVQVLDLVNFLHGLGLPGVGTAWVCPDAIHEPGRR